MSHRISQVNNLLRNELSKLVAREVEFDDAVVTLMRVEAEADLKKARVFVRVLPKEKTRDSLSRLNKRAPFLQSRINKELSMRFVPKLSFSIDQQTDKIDEATEVEQLLDSLKNQ
mgnify:CR=1 FL=1